ncbi:MAG: hypothetical protein QOC71_1753 [Thermoplasmata archaeon]|nr:hypothetical protein [Thermoplasmata archaeon]
MGAFFWIGLVVSTVLWALGSWLSGLLWPGDGVTAFIVGFVFAVMGGGVVMMTLKMRGLRSGRYEKTDWGVRKKSRWEK